MMTEVAIRRWRQVRTVARTDLKRTLGGRKGLFLLLFGGIPIALAAIRAIFLPETLRADVGRLESGLASVFYILQLRFIVYFGCAFLFVKSFRGEVLDRSLHYTLLSPIRRDVLACGKFLGGILSTWLILLPSTIGLVLVFYLSQGLVRGMSNLVSGHGVAHLTAYVAATALACIGYGALFFLSGLFFKNPMVPAAAYLGFEAVAPFMPLGLRIFSVSEHLKALLPVPISMGPMSAVSAPASAPVAIILLLSVAVFALGLAAWKTRRLEVEY